MSEKITVSLELEESEFFSGVKRMLEVLLPQLKAVEKEDAEITVKNYLTKKATGLEVISELIGPAANLSKKDFDSEILAAKYDQHDRQRRAKNKVKLQIYRLLTDYLDVPASPWGILIGVRPTKIGHFLLDKGFSYAEVREHLSQHYGVLTEKIDLLLKVIKRERNYLLAKKEASKKVSLYIGIPFCPSRCSYCSFAAYSLKEHGDHLSSFLKALNKEINRIGDWIKEKELLVDTIYLGGGTPTILTAEQLQDLMELIQQNFYQAELREFNVEAGRADTITERKLAILKEYSVDRISINPQTMNQKTLDKIGRGHSVVEFKRAYRQARNLGFENINFDLIIGLPGEGLSEFESTLQQVEELAPDSLTVHVLAIKRAAQWRNRVEQLDFPTVEEVELMSQKAAKLAKKLEMFPYYMYRQKYMLGNLENIGYAKSGLESIYNILMMEERTTVIGLGGGAITKLVASDYRQIKRLVNPKEPWLYIEEIEERTEQKLKELTSLIG
ncbi:coproporphyrinogen dehydrogenase HemZ [Fuchsiella alkaliacetigena]|uniref:coproporphyrinogen dehydrogenase HemZ n=1 Tax=Fuchsiella alkaliacetigena TaxID=957042 RepID=UPI00200B4FFE|nr:coproporphyrinogen dehydrogenase HemZ [Fuchsiella alkaliacetigena]MCK8825231.1 coproporphyrinogen dehydrogenase HemZ [Fuchsiella alkaliacetigena]